MYQSKTFDNFLKAQAKQYGSHYQSYAEEFQRLGDEDLLKAIDNNAGQMRLYADNINNDSFKEYFDELQRMIECLKLRQEFQEEMADDEL